MKNNLTKTKNKILGVNKIVVMMIWFLISGAILSLGGIIEIKDGQLNVTSDLLVDSNTLYVDSTNNRVGIGTTNPGKELEVAGRINGTELNISGNANLAYGSGKVGIGTTNPTSELHVIGNANVSGNLSAGGNSGIRIKVGSFTIDTTTASGTQAVTGIGFSPQAAVFFAAELDVVGEASWGVDDGTNKGYIADFHTNTANTYTKATSRSIHDYHIGGTDEYGGVISSMDSDGFTISWTKYGAPSGTLTVNYMAFG